MSRRNLIVGVLALFSVSKLDWEHDFRLKTIIQVEATPVFLVSDVHRDLSCIRSLDLDLDVVKSALGNDNQPSVIGTSLGPLEGEYTWV
jgi:hypothetical protein